MPKTPKSERLRDYYRKKAGDIKINRVRDVNRSQETFIPAFDRKRLQNYLKNINHNEKNLRNLSRYLCYRCYPYYRIIMYHANMFCLDARTVVPDMDLVRKNDKKSVLKSFQDTVDVLDTMHISYEMLKLLVIAFREDVAFGCAYYDDDGMFILPIDPDYCRITGVYQTGDFAFSVDMRALSRHKRKIALLGSPFTDLYEEYKQTGKRYLPMPDPYAVCIKARADDIGTNVPVFSGLLAGILNLINLDDFQAISDAQDIYKMLWLEMETRNNANGMDQWKINPDITLDYFDRMVTEAIPEYVSAAVIPGKLKSVSFDSNDKAKDSSKISNATKTLFNSSGGAQILNSSTVSGTTAFTATLQADTELAISFLLPQIESWTNRFLSYHVDTPCHVHFFEISAYTRDSFRKNLLESAQYGLPTKLAYNTLNGFSEKDTLALNYLEEDILNLSDLFVPLHSSHTESGSDTGGRPEKDEKTDDGEKSEDKHDNRK